MTNASVSTFHAKRSKNMKISLDTVVDYMRMVKSSTVHDAAKHLGKQLNADDVQESGQFWAEVVSRFGEAARKGYLDDSESFETESGSYRTLYKYNEVKQTERLTGPEKLRRRVEALENAMSDLLVYHEDEDERLFVKAARKVLEST